VIARWVFPVPVPPASTAALLGEECATSKIAHEGLVDRRALELEVVEVLGGGSFSLASTSICLLFLSL
jgi:hypothetical protein